MRIGLIVPLHGRPDGDEQAPTWQSVRATALEAERVGFDMFVFEDALLYKGPDGIDGCWESFAIAAALGEATESISFGQSVVNSPYRSPALTAKLAQTLDEISGGRYVLGIGAGNTAGSDYRAFGFPTDHRFSRFAEAIQIIHSLLKTGSADFVGEFAFAIDSELVMAGPTPGGPSITIAAGGPKMLELTARYADAWNWWSYDATFEQLGSTLGPLVSALEEACRSQQRDPSGLGRSLDLYSVVPPGFATDSAGMSNPVSGSAPAIADFILLCGDLGFEEVRCDLYPKTLDAVAAMEPVVELVHQA